MTVVRQAMTIDASPEEVWNVVSDPRNLPRWNQHIKSVHGVHGGLSRGDSYWTELKIVGVPFKIGAVVVEIDPPRFSHIRLFGPLDATVHTWVRPVGKSRTHLEHEVDYSIRGGPVGSLIARGVRVLGAPTILKRGMRAQKQQIEVG